MIDKVLYEQINYSIGTSNEISYRGMLSELQDYVASEYGYYISCEYNHLRKGFKFYIIKEDHSEVFDKGIFTERLEGIENCLEYIITNLC